MTMITYAKTINLGNYQSERIEIQDQPLSGETHEQCLARLKSFVETQGKAIKPQTAPTQPIKPKTPSQLVSESTTADQKSVVDVTSDLPVAKKTKAATSDNITHDQLKAKILELVKADPSRRQEMKGRLAKHKANTVKDLDAETTTLIYTEITA